jgi:hypothetical protein
MPERPYVDTQPARARTAEELRAAIPGWGADLDAADRPSVPRERFDLPPTGAHWEFPAQQPHEGYREKSIEHARLTPVFGTVAPLHGISGRIRRLAYERFSEGRAAHWLLLILGDRVESAGSQLRSLVSLRPDNPITETGVLAEFRRGGVRSRVGRGRVDLAHTWIDPLKIAAPYVVGGVILWRVIRKVRGRR